MQHGQQSAAALVGLGKIADGKNGRHAEFF